MSADRREKGDQHLQVFEVAGINRKRKLRPEKRGIARARRKEREEKRSCRVPESRTTISAATQRSLMKPLRGEEKSRREKAPLTGNCYQSRRTRVFYGSNSLNDRNWSGGKVVINSEKGLKQVLADGDYSKTRQRHRAGFMEAGKGLTRSRGSCSCLFFERGDLEHEPGGGVKRNPAPEIACTKQPLRQEKGGGAEGKLSDRESGHQLSMTKSDEERGVQHPCTKERSLYGLDETSNGNLREKTAGIRGYVLVDKGGRQETTQGERTPFQRISLREKKVVARKGGAEKKKTQ